jgi:hypothetical protein
MVELTIRVTGGLFLLKPSPELNARILGILGRALALYPISLHAFVFLSTHWHALATVCHAERLAAFLQYVNGNLAKAVQEVHGWNGKVWGRRTQVIPVVDDAAAEGRLRYILAHGAKEGLVASPLDWPGVSSARALAFGDALVGVWQDRAREARMRRRGPAPRDAVLRRYPIDLVPLPSWSETTAETRQATVQRMLADIERDARQAHPVVLGANAVQAQDPVTRLQAPASSPAPPVHGVDQETRRSFIAARRQFVSAYRAATVASAALAMSLAMRYPAGAFPSRPPPAPPAGHAATPTMVQPREVWHPPSLDRAPHAELARRGAASNREVPWSRT